MRLYVDSNVLLCYIKSELGGLSKAMVFRCEEFFIKAKTEGHVFLLSDLTFREIEKIGYYSRSETESLLSFFGISFEVTLVSADTKHKSGFIERDCGIHYPDSLHVQLALESNADLIVTWNLKDFKKTERLVRCVSPEEFNLM